jgi:effector-binding domain-containing protein
VSYEVTLADVEPSRLAVIPAEVPADVLGDTLPGLLDQVFTAASTGAFEQSGPIVVVYRDLVDAVFRLEAGVRVAGDFEPLEGVVPASVPGGRCATTTHVGPYAELPKAHWAITGWAKERGRQLAGLNWEVYGPWNDDPALLRTDVFYLLAD